MLSKLVVRIRRLFGGKCGDLSIPQAAAMVGRPGVFFFDVNSAQRYARGHVPGARNIGRGKLDASLLPSDKQATLIFYCGGPD